MKNEEESPGVRCCWSVIEIRTENCPRGVTQELADELNERIHAGGRTEVIGMG